LSFRFLPISELHSRATDIAKTKGLSPDKFDIPEIVRIKRELMNERNRKAKVKKRDVSRLHARKEPVQTFIEVERSGDWMPVEDLREASLAASGAGNDVTVNLDRIDHLDASSLQILLALDVEQKKRGATLQLANLSPHLRQWFEFAGAAEHFFPHGAEQK
jgi:anti-anti-sigma regulatory factor